MIHLVLSLDYEIFGNGSGDVRRNMIEPTDRLLALCNKYGAKLSIMLEVGEYWAMKRAEETGSLHLGYSPSREIEKQIKVKPGKYDMLGNLVIGKNCILLLGSTFHKDDEGIQDYIMLLDNDLNMIWDKELEDKWEGGIQGITYENDFLIATNNDSECIIYQINIKGKIVKKETIISTGIPMVEELTKMPDQNLLLVCWSMGDKNAEQKLLITLSNDLTIINETVVPFNRLDGYKNSSYPEVVKYLNNGKIALLWNGNPPMTMLSNPYDTTSAKIEHFRYDIYFNDIEPYNDNSYIYSGKLGDKSAVFLIDQNNIISKVVYDKMGTWSHNRIFKISNTDYILITDKIRSNDFESNIEIIRLNIN